VQRRRRRIEHRGASDHLAAAGVTKEHSVAHLERQRRVEADPNHRLVRQIDRSEPANCRRHRGGSHVKHDVARQVGAGDSGVEYRGAPPHRRCQECIAAPDLLVRDSA
jgi:hypothetical protein